jgi:site-specific DNA recombinase
VRNLVTLTKGALPRLDPIRDEISPAEQALVVPLLLERVNIGAAGVSVRLRIGLAAFAR